MSPYQLPSQSIFDSARTREVMQERRREIEALCEVFAAKNSGSKEPAIAWIMVANDLQIINQGLSAGRTLNDAAMVSQIIDDAIRLQAEGVVLVSLEPTSDKHLLSQSRLLDLRQRFDSAGICLLQINQMYL
ncbi:hypothetical protein [Sphingomonas sp. LHG3443-2]|uniref:hypothetical protein n=1 Tax=Sphingomonas sp. LHG3443-2 TaxID=2804639 RepID=UPI003CF27A25